MKTKISFLIIGALVLMNVTGCKEDKKDPEPAPSKTKTDYLTTGKWTVTEATVNPGIDIDGTVITDFFSQFENCTKDDWVKYETNSTTIYDEGATKCDPDDPQTTAGIWKFSNNETVLIENEDTSNIDQLDESTIKLSQIFEGDGDFGKLGIKYKITMTAKHK